MSMSPQAHILSSSQESLRGGSRVVYSFPSVPDDRHWVAGKRALALGGARSQGHNTILRGLVPRALGFPSGGRRGP